MSTNLIRLLLFVAIAATVSAQPPAQLRLEADERLGIIRISVRPTFISPSQVTIEEGLYRVILDDSSLVAGAVGIDFEDERGATSRQATTRPSQLRTEFYQHFPVSRQLVPSGGLFRDLPPPLPPPRPPCASPCAGGNRHEESTPAGRKTRCVIHGS